MKKTDALVQQQLPGIQDRAVLEVACGSGDFSLAAAPFSSSITCIDLDGSRLNPLIHDTEVRFQVMDASDMRFPDDSFDSVVLYNAFSHIQSQWRAIAKECRRVVREDGAIYVVGHGKWISAGWSRSLGRTPCGRGTSSL